MAFVNLSIEMQCVVLLMYRPVSENSSELEQNGLPQYWHWSVSIVFKRWSISSAPLSHEVLLFWQQRSLIRALAGRLLV